MFYETAQTVGPGWHRSYKPSHYEDMSWSPSSKNFRSPGSSPETYRRIIRTEEDFPSRNKEYDDEFFSGRKSPTFPRRIFKEVWNDSSPNHRFSDRPRMFKRVFKPSHWEDEFDRDVPHLRRVEREFDRPFEDNRPSSRKFDDDFDRHFGARDLQKDIEQEFEKSEGRVHHIPIMVERRMEELKSRFGRNSPPPENTGDEEYAEEWSGPQVQRLRKTFEPEDGFTTRHRVPRSDFNSKPRPFTKSVPETWDPHAVHTLPTRKAHKSSQSFDDSRHPVPPKYVFRSYSETHEDVPKPQQQHSAAFRSHSDGHCPNQTYITKIEVNVPTKNDNVERSSSNGQDGSELTNRRHEPSCDTSSNQESGQSPTVEPTKQSSDDSEAPVRPPRSRNKYDSPSLQQIAVVLQNVEDLIVRVEGYNGSGRDKHYRFLDEMLTRCMLRLDDVDTEGREDIRNARKAAVREVQSCIDRLEAKADESERRMKSKAIPLGDVPRKDEPNQQTDIQNDTKDEKTEENSGNKSENGEQTKL